MSEPAPSAVTAQASEATGVLYAGFAYCAWGILPLYWRLLGDVPAFELTVHRVLWCAVFVAAVTAARGHMPRIIAIAREPRTVAMLALSSLMIGCNWTLYIYCVAADRLVESALGYYMTPLVSFALGYLLLGERMSRLKVFAVSLAGLAVIVQAVSLGGVPWISPALALTFGIYGYLRKKIPVAALDGLLIETLLLFPFTVVLVGWWSLHGGAFPSPRISTNLLLIAAGPMTAVPLALFAAGARRVRMTTLGFLQYLAPSITLMIAVFMFHEPFTSSDLVSFGCVWAAIVIAAVEGGALKLPVRLRT
ncbi:MAG: EamA family transporter RarD [Rhodospirillaceae bacterium]